MNNKQFNLMKQKSSAKEYYELILYYQGSVVYKRKTSNYTSYKGEFERLQKMTKENSSYELVANLYDFENNFEKRMY